MSLYITLSNYNNRNESHRHQSTAAIVNQHIKSLFDTHFRPFRRSCANELEGEGIAPASMINVLLSIIGDQTTFDKNQQLCHKYQLLDSVVLFRRICHNTESEKSIFISELAPLYEMNVSGTIISKTTINFIQAEIDRLSDDCLKANNTLSGLLERRTSGASLSPEVQEYWDTLIDIQSAQNLHRQYCYLLFLLEVFEWPTLQRISTELTPFIQDDMEKEYQLNFTIKIGICLASGNASNYDVQELSKHIDTLQSHRSKTENVCDRNLLTVLYNMRGCAQLSRERHNEALKDFEESLTIDPKFAHAWNNKGKCLLDMNNREGAQQCYSKAIELDSTLSFAYSNRAAVFCQQEMLKEALKDYTAAVELDTNNATLYNNRGMIYSKLGQLEKAIADHSKAIEIRPYYTEAIHNRADVLVKALRCEEAAADYTACIEMEGDDLALYNLRGMCYSMLEKHEEAFQDYSKVMDMIETTDPTLLLQRGRTVVAMGLHFLGLQDLATVIEDSTVDNSKRAKALLVRAQSYDSLNRHSEAASDYEQSFELNRTDPELYLSRGMHYATQGKASKALQDYSTCIEMDEKNWKAYLNRSIVYESKRQYDMALSDAKRGYELNGNNIRMKARYLRLKEFKEFRQRYKQK